jgi:hypothetical protein
MKIQNCLQVKVFVWEEAQIHEDNNFFGDLSAILIENMPIWAEFSSTPSNRISLMSDWETKLPLLSMIRKRKRNQFCRCPFLDVSFDE